MSLEFVSHTEASIAAPEFITLPTGEVLPYGEFVRRLVKEMGSDIQNRLHAAVGIAGEAGELLDAIKKNWAYGKPVDTGNILEELGDLEFYCAAMRMLMFFSRDAVLQANANKLSKRYGDTYSDAAAIARADKVATGETDSSGAIDTRSFHAETVMEQQISGVFTDAAAAKHIQEMLRTGQVNAINLSAEQMAAVDETAGIITGGTTANPANSDPTATARQDLAVQTPAEEPTGNLPDPLLP